MGARRKTLTSTLGGRRSSRGKGEGDDDEQRERRSSSIPLQSIFRRTGSSSTQTQIADLQTSPTPSQSALPATLTISSTINTDPNSPSSTYLPQIHPADQPMRQEAERAFRTFLVPGAERELNVTDEMRTRCRVALEGSTHPEVVSLLFVTPRNLGEDVNLQAEVIDTSLFLVDLRASSSLSGSGDGSVLTRIQGDLWVPRDANIAAFPVVCADQHQSPETSLLVSPASLVSVSRSGSSGLILVHSPRTRRYGVGLTDIAISVLILVLMVVLLPGKSFAWRLPRLVSVLFASFGAMQTYSVSQDKRRRNRGAAGRLIRLFRCCLHDVPLQAWRGFCTQVWGRASRQLHPWEMESKEEREAKQADPRRGSVDLEGGAWVNPWAENPPCPTSPIEKGSTEIDERVWLPTFGNQGPNVLDRQADREDPLDPLSAGSEANPVHQDNLDQALSTHSWDGPAPRLAMGYSVGDMSDISPWDEPPGQTTIGNTNSNTHLIFPVSEKEDNEGSGSSSAVQRRRSAGMQQSTLLRRLLRENKNIADEVTAPLPKPPVFGDEIVLVDERVIRLHKQVVRDILLVGAVWGLVWIAVCLAIPTN
jgi:hypothetical protein